MSPVCFREPQLCSPIECCVDIDDDSRCKEISEEGQACEVQPSYSTKHVYKRNCPCRFGFKCIPKDSNSNEGICKKDPNAPTLGERLLNVLDALGLKLDLQ